MIKIGVGVGVSFGQQGAGAAYTVRLTGLTNGEARQGAAIGLTITPAITGETVTYQWTANGANISGATTDAETVAIGTDHTDGQVLRCVVTIDGEPYTSNAAPMRFAPGTASAIADGQTATVDDTVLNIAATASGANLTFTYSLIGAPAGMTTNASTGGIGGTVTEVFDGTVTLRATDQYGRTYDDPFTFTASLRTQATAANGLGPFSFTIGDEAVVIDFTTDFTANGNTLSYAITGLPAGGVDDGDGTTSGTAVQPASSGSVVCTATDEYGRQTTSTATVTTALRAQATGGTDLDLSFVEDSAITSTDLVANWTAGGNTLSFVSVSPALPAGLSISSAGAMTGTPTDVTADATYTLTMEDEYGRQTSDTFTLEITSATFSPASLFASGEAGAWYQPSPSTCFTDTAGTTPAGVGDAVARINDSSGNGHHATQGTAANRPTLQQTAGGLYYLDFDGTNDHFQTAAIDFTGTGQVSVFAGVTNEADAEVIGATARVLVELSASASSTPGTFVLFSTFNNGGTPAIAWRAHGGTARTVFSNHPASPYTEVLTGFANMATDTIILRRDGSQVGISTSDLGASTAFGDFVLNIGSRNAADFFFDGRLFSLIVRGAATTGTPLSDAETYVADKTGVTL